MTADVNRNSVDTIEAQLASAIEAVKAKDRFANVYLVACGGSFANMLPIEHLLETETGRVAVHALNAREFTTRMPKALGEHSLVISCSHSGDTPETVRATSVAREAGATTIALTNLGGSPLDEAAEFAIYYQHGEGRLYAYSASPLLYRLSWAIIDELEGTEWSARASAAAAELDGIVAQLQKEHGRPADVWAKAHRREALIYTLGSGPNYGQSYAFAICFLQEMLWVHSQAIHSAEYFHGPFEITEDDVPFIELLGLGPSREIDQRAHDFVTRTSEHVLTLDAEEWDLSRIDAALRPSYTQLVFGPLLRVYADALSDHRGHPMTVRRYMWRTEY